MQLKLLYSTSHVAVFVPVLIIFLSSELGPLSVCISMSCQCKKKSYYNISLVLSAIEHALIVLYIQMHAVCGLRGAGTTGWCGVSRGSVRDGPGCSGACC